MSHEMRPSNSIDLEETVGGSFLDDLFGTLQDWDADHYEFHENDVAVRAVHESGRAFVRRKKFLPGRGEYAHEWEET